MVVLLPVAVVEAVEATEARDWEEEEARGGKGARGGGPVLLGRLLLGREVALFSDQTSHRNHDRLRGVMGLDCIA